MASKIAKNRIMFEIKNYIKNYKTLFDNIIELDPSGIYLHVDESNIYKFYALILGPKNTPYENGFYAFNIEITDEYPFKSPKVTHLTTGGGNIRFHPNLYSTGKVCLSILGTWNGPKWTSTMTIMSLLQSIRMIMDEDPLRNEPGYNNLNTYINEAMIFKKFAQWNNYSVAILGVYTLKEYPVFNELIKLKFNELFDENISCIKKFIEDTEGKEITYNMVVYTSLPFTIDWTTLLNNFIQNKTK